jgi:hypothetical protein
MTVDCLAMFGLSRIAWRRECRHSSFPRKREPSDLNVPKALGPRFRGDDEEL